jgi:hypothetical protein
MPSKNKEADGTGISRKELRAVKSKTKATMKLFVDAEVDKQRQRHLECLDALDKTCQAMKRQPLDAVEVNQILKAISNESLDKYEKHVNGKVMIDFSEEQITAELVRATKTCDQALILLSEASKTLEEMNRLLRVCSHTSGSI